MRVLHLLAATVAAAAAPINADIKVVKVDADGAHTVKHFESVDLDQFNSFEDLVKSLQLNELDTPDVQEEKKSLLEQIKSFENTEEALDYFRQLVVDTFNHVDDYFNPEDEEIAQIAELADEDNAGNSQHVAPYHKRPHGAKIHKGKFHKGKFHKGKFHKGELHKGEFESKFHGKPHHEAEFLKNHPSPHSVKSFVKECDGEEAAPSSWESYVNYIKSWGITANDGVVDENSENNVDAPFYRQSLNNLAENFDMSENPETCTLGIFSIIFLYGLFFATVRGVVKRVRVRNAASEAASEADSSEDLPPYEDYENDDEEKLLNEKN